MDKHKQVPIKKLPPVPNKTLPKAPTRPSPTISPSEQKSTSPIITISSSSSSQSDVTKVPSKPKPSIDLSKHTNRRLSVGATSTAHVSVNRFRQTQLPKPALNDNNNSNTQNETNQNQNETNNSIQPTTTLQSNEPTNYFKKKDQTNKTQNTNLFNLDTLNELNAQSPSLTCSTLSPSGTLSNQINQSNQLHSLKSPSSPKSPNLSNHQEIPFEIENEKGFLGKTFGFFKRKRSVSTSQTSSKSVISASSPSDSFIQKDSNLQMSSISSKHSITPQLENNSEHEKSILEKYTYYFLDDDQEAKIHYVPKNKKGEKVYGNDIMMHTAELIFTEIIFCCKLQLFQKLETEVKMQHNLKEYEKYLLFNPLDNLVEIMSKLCNELEPFYYGLLETNKKKESEENYAFLTIYVYNKYVKKNEFKKYYLECVAHYTSLSNDIMTYLHENKSLNKIIDHQLESCLDTNIKELSDFFILTTQRICRYELLFSSILNDIKFDCTIKNVLQETIDFFKQMNSSINQFVSNTKLYYMKKYEYLKICYDANLPMQTCHTIRKAFACGAEDYEDIFVGIKNSYIPKQTELLIFKKGLLKRYIENNFFEFYPINSLSVETCNMKDMSWKDSLGEKDIYWYDIRKRKVQIIEMLDLNEKLRFQRKLNDVFAQFINSLEQ